MHCALAVHVVGITPVVTIMGNTVELIAGLLWTATIPTIEASIINFARILEERIFISYLLFILLFIANVESQSINPAARKGT